MKKLLLPFCLLGAALVSATVPALAQDESTTPKDSIWTTDATFSLTLSQVGLSNWAGGGESSLSVGSEFNASANLVRDNFTWSNSLEAGLSYIREGDNTNAFKKNNDLLIINSRFGQKLNKNWQISAALDFRTQLVAGYRYAFVDSLDRETRTLTSNFLAPGYLLTSLGITYNKNKNFSATLAPLTGKFTFVMVDSLSQVGAYGVEPGEMSRAQLGASFSMNYKRQIMENVEFRTSLLLFGDYETLPNIDVNWEAFLRFKINKYLTSSLSTQLIWDEDIDINRQDGTVGPAVQFRNVINIGFSATFW